MLAEFSRNVGRGFFRGGLLNEGRCGLGGNHRIIIPPLFTFPCPTRTHIHTHAVEHSPFPPLTRESLKGEFNPQLGVGGYLQPLQMVLFTFYKDCL